jgi:hypothetical protein
VIDPGGTFLEQRRDYYDVVLSCRGGESLAGRPGNRLGQVEERMIFALAEILRLEKFGQAHDFSPAPGRIGHAFEGFSEILFGFRSAGHLHQSYTKFVRGHGNHLLRARRL